MREKTRERPFAVTLAQFSLLLAIFFLLLPLHADFVASASIAKNAVLVIKISSIILGLVAAPGIASIVICIFKRRAYHVARYLVPTFALIALNWFMAVTTVQRLNAPNYKRIQDNALPNSNSRSRETVYDILDHHASDSQTPPK